MGKVRTTLTIDEDVLRAVRLRAASAGISVSEVIEHALRRHLGVDALEAVWANVDPLPESDATTLALEAQRFSRKQR